MDMPGLGGVRVWIEFDLVEQKITALTCKIKLSCGDIQSLKIHIFSGIRQI